jgi:long-chain acyl-CoA synthetase
MPAGFQRTVGLLFLECHDRITSAVKASGGLRERLFNVAYNAKKDALEKGQEKCLPF